MNTIEIIKEFKASLANTDGSAHATIKNYASDVTKYIRWFEEYHSSPFTFIGSHRVLLENYQAYLRIENTPQPSIYRYFSSLRKFYNFVETRYAFSNPFIEMLPKVDHEAQDLHLSEFKDYLYVFGSAELTAKNYSMDIRSFKLWRQKDLHVSDISVFDHVTEDIISKYKSYLLKDARLSIGNTNRQISSIRKYRAFGYAYGYIKKYENHMYIYKFLAFENKYANIQKYQTVYSAFLILILATVAFTILGINVRSLPDGKNRTYASYAMPPRIFTFHGKLTDYNNNPITEPSDISIGLYRRDPLGQDPILLWEEVQYAVLPKTNGSILLRLGVTKKLPLHVLTDDNLFMTIKINNNDIQKERVIVYTLPTDLLILL